jgi:hypothetical protein
MLILSSVSRYSLLFAAAAKAPSSFFITAGSISEGATMAKTASLAKS